MRVALERLRTGPLPLSFSYCFCGRREARGRIINSSSHSADHSRVQHRSKGQWRSEPRRSDRPEEPGERHQNRLHYLSLSLSITRPGAIVTRHRQWTDLLFRSFLFFPQPISFYIIVVSISGPFAASRPGTSRFISIHGSVPRWTIIVFYCVPLQPLTIYSCAEISTRVDSSKCEWNSRDTEIRRDYAWLVKLEKMVFLVPFNGTWSLAFGSIISFLSMILWPV